MPGSTTELIKEKLDIVQFLKGYLTLVPAGKNFKALCPFHHEKTPSFMVSPDRQSWHCFGCALGGDIFTFVMRYENLEFADTLKVLAERAGVELRRLSPSEYHVTGLLYDLNQAAKDFFVEELSRAGVTQKYLGERGLKKETIEEFELGWAPAERENLNLYLLNKGYRPEDIVRAGLAFKTERGLQMDRFRGRIMFPIHNHLGKVVGFTGRILPALSEVEGPQNPSTGASTEPFGGELRAELLSRMSSGLASAKYVNSPETAIFNKSKLLYGFWKSRNYIRDASSAFLVEGQMDFLMSWQAGVKNTIASSGTAFTVDHLRTLRRLTDQLVISFDNDEAGAAAGERAIDLAESQDFGVKVLMLKNAKDPAEAAERDPEAFRASVEKAKPAPEFYFDRYLPQSFNYSNRDDLRNLRVVLSKIKQMVSPVEKSFWLKELSKRVRIEEKAIFEEMEKAETGKSESSEKKEPERIEPRSFSRRELISQRLLSTLIQSNKLAELGESLSYLPEEYRKVVKVLESGASKTTDPEIDALLNFILLRSEELKPNEIEMLKQELAKEYTKEMRLELTRKVKDAEASGNETSLRSALEELQKLSLVESVS